MVLWGHDYTSLVSHLNNLELLVTILQQLHFAGRLEVSEG